MLVVRPEPGLGETIAALRERGRHGVSAPTQRIVPIPLRLRPLTRLGAVLFTSGQAVAALARCGALPRGCPVLAVGDATARRARDAGFSTVESAGGDATALRRLVRSRLRPEGGTLLLVCGDGQALPLARELRGDGFRVLRRVVYRAERERLLGEEVLEAVRSGRVEAALFFSGDAAEAFRRSLPAVLHEALAEIRALVISERTAAALAGTRWKSVEVAAAPNAAAVLTLLERADRDG